ncbi:MAG: hypothetical protein H0X65_16835, partial [Gemmatimonadetes bacterium]|nr:hypothetical protein [Gemmatimonadota bacterium]
MMDASYPPPLDRLLTLGAPDIDEWLEYRELGFGEEHIPELIRMATDEELIRGETEDPAIWAPVHASRALGQLRAEAAIEPLIARFHESDEDDWVAEELPEVFAMIGPAAIPALSRYLQDRSQPRWPRMTAATSLKNIA